MSIAALLIGLALLALAVSFVAGPIINERRERKFLTDEPEADESQSRYEEILLALRDLDFDHRLGVVSDEDYPALRAQLLAEAAEAHTAAEQEAARKKALEAQIEAAVQAARGRAPAAAPAASAGRSCRHCAAPLAPGDNFCPACGAPTAELCPQCNRQIDPGDKFCAGCGLNLTAAATGEATA